MDKCHRDSSIEEVLKNKNQKKEFHTIKTLKEAHQLSVFHSFKFKFTRDT